MNFAGRYCRCICLCLMYLIPITMLSACAVEKEIIYFGQPGDKVVHRELHPIERQLDQIAIRVNEPFSINSYTWPQGIYKGFMESKEGVFFKSPNPIRESFFSSQEGCMRLAWEDCMWIREIARLGLGWREGACLFTTQQIL